MTDENKLATLLAICDYALYGVEPKLKDAMARAVFTVARPSIDANKARRDNGKKGGRPKKPMVSDSENLWFSKNESTETETGTEAVSESESGAKGAGKPPTPIRNKFGEYGWVRLTEAEHSKLLADLGETELSRCIEYIDTSAQSNGNKNRWKDWNLVLRRCAREGWGRAEQKGGAEDDYWSRQ